MTTNQMRYFVTLCKTGSYTKTAELLYVTQPAISRQIAALEEELGTQLLIRNSGRLFEITPTGKAYFELFQDFIDGKEFLDYRTKTYEFFDKQILKIGLLAGWHLPLFMKNCSEEIMGVYPDLDFCFDSYEPEKINQLLENDALDMAIVPEPVFKEYTGYYKEFLLNIQTAFFVSAKSKSAVSGSVCRDRIDGPFICNKQLERTRHSSFQYSEVITNGKVVIREYDSHESVLQNVLAYDGVALCDEWSYPFFSGLYAADILENYPIPVVLVRKRISDPRYLSAADILKKCILDWHKCRMNDE